MDVKIFDIKERSFWFGVETVKLVTDLPKNTAGFSVGGQVVRSGTSIGANINIEEAQNAPTKKEFIHGMTIALREARETEFWLRIIVESNLIGREKIDKLIEENRELIKILTAIVKNSKLKK